MIAKPVAFVVDDLVRHVATEDDAHESLSAQIGSLCPDILADQRRVELNAAAADHRGDEQASANLVRLLRQNVFAQICIDPLQPALQRRSPIVQPTSVAQRHPDQACADWPALGALLREKLLRVAQAATRAALDQIDRLLRVELQQAPAQFT